MTTRRTFLKRSAIIAAATPSVLSQGYVKAQDINSRPTVAAIGVGGSRGRYSRGGQIGVEAGRLGETIAVCDVDQTHNDEYDAKFGGKLKKYTDYRRLFDEQKPDIVTIGTPDHWHVPIAIAAMRNGSDVYCEKPLTLTIDEGIEICKVVKETGKIFQVGTQQRSSKKTFLHAIGLVQSGRLGENVNAYVAIGGAPNDGPFESSPKPEGLDWDFWVGPAPAADYCSERRAMFRWWLEYSGGKMTDWGAHHIDIAQWALGHSETGPVSVKGTGQFGNAIPKEGMDWFAFLNGERKLPNGFNAATKFSINLTFADDSIINVNHHYKREDGTDFGNGILFEGEKGRIFVNRGKLTGGIVESLTDDDYAELDERAKALCKGKSSGDHMKNFFECVEDRSLPISDVFTHHRIMTSCHLCNIALMLGRELKWDPETEDFVGDEVASSLKSRKSRDKYLV